MEPNLAELLTRARGEEPHKTALSEAATGRSATWLELDELAWGVARGLYAAGLVAGVRVALLVTPCVESVAAYLGTLRAGMVAVPVDPAAPTGELVRVLVDSGARLVVCDGVGADTVRAAVQGLGEALTAAGRDATSRPRVVTVGVEHDAGERSWDDLVGSGADQAVPLRADPEALAALLYTSGASGRPRAAMLTHRALVTNVDQVARGGPFLHGNDVVLGVVPLHHTYGLCAVLGQVLRQHARLVLVPEFHAEGSLDIVEDEAVTVAPLTPWAVEAWLGVPGLDDRVGPLRHVVSSAAALAPEAAAAFTARTGLPVHQGYGLTECGPVVTSTLVPPPGDRPDGSPDSVSRSVGRALPGVELRLVDERGHDAAPGDPGGLLVRGPQLFSGYWPDGRGGPRDDGWWPTGDVGLLDESGELHLVDRERDTVLVAGFTVFPVEVEEVVGELAEVGAVAVVGAEDPDGPGEVVVAFVCRADGTELLDGADLAQQVVRHCEQRLAGFKVPVAVHVVDDLPRTATGKVQKGRLRAWARGRDAEPLP
ncbi:class I adenylate-forming enzyme family protein [Nocardioides marmoraquaticus]